MVGSGRLYWLLAVLGLTIIGGGTTLYYKKVNKPVSPEQKTESVPVVESTPTETETSDTPSTTTTNAAVTASISASATTLVNLSEDISDIEEDTSSSNTDDDKPNY